MPGFQTNWTFHFDLSKNLTSLVFERSLYFLMRISNSFVIYVFSLPAAIFPPSYSLLSFFLHFLFYSIYEPFFFICLSIPFSLLTFLQYLLPSSFTIVFLSLSLAFSFFFFLSCLYSPTFFFSYISFLFFLSIPACFFSFFLLRF